jgi:hypothetical protein
MAEKICFTVHVYELPAHESHQSRLAHVAQALQAVANSARGAGGVKKSGIVFGDYATPLAEWAYQPSESASQA